MDTLGTQRTTTLMP